jgi:hypothetical protein
MAFILFHLISSPLGSTSFPQADSLIDDFSRDDRLSALNTEWRSFSDRVMGGVSLGQHRFETIAGKRCIRLTGTVSLANNGGFVQVALPLGQRGQPFDASKYQGIRITVRGNDERYYLHIRSRQSQRPWQYFAADFQATGDWKTLEIPFADFKPEGMQDSLDTTTLLRMAIVAAWKDFEADVAVARLEFYR